MHVIKSPSIDRLFLEGAALILREGRNVESRAGKALQISNVTYVLTDSMSRIFQLRNPISKKYLCRELLAYFRGEPSR